MVRAMKIIVNVPGVECGNNCVELMIAIYKRVTLNKGLGAFRQNKISFLTSSVLTVCQKKPKLQNISGHNAFVPGDMHTTRFL